MGHARHDRKCTKGEKVSSRFPNSDYSYSLTCVTRTTSEADGNSGILKIDFDILKKKCSLFSFRLRGKKKETQNIVSPELIVPCPQRPPFCVLCSEGWFKLWA
ncbi:hypothetical protein CEXT_475941 [Caerostris extrusa]|uniref:Uncharacterized protein n=1 Tax=Caerostris extrusa TaxID=172846 RepID=A0AAV4SZA9_CAEEX|nr:hypothetical protein CEXT_475941 [Caerostris extrusa]